MPRSSRKLPDKCRDVACHVWSKRRPVTGLLSGRANIRPSHYRTNVGTWRATSE
ncbi:MAG: hypothetical protein HDS16_07140 [Bacteroides sp.]|nr:hypothetical protein [Bacteroides sp.]